MSNPVVDARKEAAKAGRYPSRKFNKREDKIVESVLNSVVLAESVTWDFSVQGGAAGTVTLSANPLPTGAIVTGVLCVVQTAITGSGSIKLVGSVDGDLTQTLSSASSGVVVGTIAPHQLTAANALQVTIATGLTAGKVAFYLTFLLP
jgi:hypothetical protein